MRRDLAAADASAGAARLESLDGLRGVAAIIVLIFHVGVFAGVPIVHAYQAVDFFFILSGFVIGVSYEERLRSDLAVSAFMSIRLLRMYPALFPSMLLGLTMTVLGFGPDPFSPLLLMNFLMLPVFVGHSVYPLNGPMWSVFFELLANLAHAIALPLLTTRRLAVATGACGVLLTIVAYKMNHVAVGWMGDRPWSFVFVAGFVRVGWGYLVGLLMYRMIKAGRLRAIRAPFWAAPVALGAALLLPNLLGWLQHVLLALVVFPLILLAALGPQPQGRARTVGVWLGGISYALYASHVTVLWVAHALSGGLDFSTPSGQMYWCAWGVAALLIAIAFERFYDGPLRAWLRLRRSGHRALAPAAVGQAA